MITYDNYVFRLFLDDWEMPDISLLIFRFAFQYVVVVTAQALQLLSQARH